MRALGEISRLALGVRADVQKSQNQGANSAEHGATITGERRTDNRATDAGNQRNSICKISRMANTASSDSDRDAIANSSANLVIYLIGFWPCTKHLGQLLTTTTTLFVTSPTAAMLNFDECIRSFLRTDYCLDRGLFIIHAYQRLSGAISSNGRNFAATASLARKIRDRTVPIGQFMMPAISS